MPGVYNLGTATGTIVLNASSISRTSAALRTLGLGLIGIGAAGVIGFGAVVKSSADFEKIMSGTQSALAVTDAQMKVVKETALELGANSIYGAKQVGLAIEQLAFAGLSVKEITGGAAKATIDLAQASGGLIGLDIAGRTVVNTMRTFGLTTKDTAHIADILAGAANKSTIDIEDMVTSLRYVGPAAHTAGLSLDDVAQSLAILGDRGIRGSTAGTSLRGILVALVNPSEKATGIMKELGIITKDGANIMFDASGKMKSMAQVAQLLQDHTKGLTREQKLAAFGSIFQRRAMASALVLAEQGAAGFDKYKKAIASGGSASDIAAVRLNNLSGDFSLLRSQIESMVIRAGTPFQDVLRKIVQGLTGVLKVFAVLPRSVQTGIIAFIGIGGAIFVLLGTLALFASSVIRMIAVFQDVAEGIKIASKAIQLFSAGLLTNPVFLIIAAIILLIAIFVILFIKVKPFREFMIKMWNGIKEAALAFWDAVFPTLKAIGIWLGENIPKAIRTVVSAFKTAFNAIKSFFGTTLGKVVAGAIALVLAPILTLAAAVFLIIRNWSSITGFFRSLWDSVTGFFQNAVTSITTALRPLGAYFQKNIMPAVSAFGELVSAVFQNIAAIIRLFWAVAQPIIRGFRIALVNEFNIAKAAVQGLIIIFQFAMANIVAAINLVVGIIRAVWDPLWPLMRANVEIALLAIQSAITLVIAFIQAIWNPFWNGLKAVVVAVWDAVKEATDAAFQVLAGIFKLITAILTGDWSKAWEGIKNIIAGAWDFIVAVTRLAVTLLVNSVKTGLEIVLNLFRDMPGVILGIVANFGSLLLNAGGALMLGLLGGIQTGFTAVTDFLFTIYNNIFRFFADAITWLEDAGKKIIQGLINGILSMLGPVGGAVEKVAGFIKDHWPFSPAKRGPLKRHPPEEWGRNIVGGVITGMTKTMPNLTNMLSDVANQFNNISPEIMFTTGIASGTPRTTIGAGANFAVTSPLADSTGDTLVVEEGDTFNLETHTDADSTEIIDEFMWAKRLRA